MAKKYPEHREQVLSLLDESEVDGVRVKRKSILDSLLGKDSKKFYEDLSSLKIDHEIMRHLGLSADQKAEKEKNSKEKLEEKKSKTKNISYQEIMKITIDLLTRKTKTVGKKSAYSYASLALGIALATGRRQIEVLRLGTFKKISDQLIEYNGFAKKRGGVDYSTPRDIYCLVDADVVIRAVEILRSLPEVEDLKQYDNLNYLEQNTMINRRCAKNLQNTVRSVLGDDYDFKDSRPIYMRICYDFFHNSPRWKSSDEDIFFKHMLGHESFVTQQAYKQFKVDYTLPPEKPKEPIKTRLDALTDLDSNQEIATRKALTNIHNEVKDAVKVDPHIKITKSWIIREVGSGRTVIEDYLKIANDVINIEDHQEDITYITPPKSLIQKTQESESLSSIKPRFKPKKLNDGTWLVTAYLDGTEVAKGTGNTQMEAAKSAFEKIPKS